MWFVEQFFSTPKDIPKGHLLEGGSKICIPGKYPGNPLLINV
jgi:hypothetical protein